MAPTRDHRRPAGAWLLLVVLGSTSAWAAAPKRLFVCAAQTDRAAAAEAPGLRSHLARVLRDLALHEVTDGPSAVAEPGSARCHRASARVRAAGLSGARWLLLPRLAGVTPSVRLELFDAVQPRRPVRQASATPAEAGSARAAVELAVLRLFLTDLQLAQTPCASKMLRPGMACIPGGVYRLGFDEGEQAQVATFCRGRRIPDADCRLLDARAAAESLARWAYLDTFLIDRYEVTCRQYDRCIDEGRCGPLSEYGRARCNDPGLPVVNVGWTDAQAYCAWVRKRLPTEAEWEAAARGPSHLLWPWTSFWEPERANLGPDGPLLREEFRDRERASAHPAIGGAFIDDRSPFSVMDMAGNVSEWTADLYSADYPAQAPVLRPRGPAVGERRVVRGGNFVENPYFGLLGVRRGVHLGVGGANLLGFRCAAAPGQENPRERSEGHEGIRFED